MAFLLCSTTCRRRRCTWMCRSAHLSLNSFVPTSHLKAFCPPLRRRRCMWMSAHLSFSRLYFLPLIKQPGAHLWWESYLEMHMNGPECQLPLLNSLVPTSYLTFLCPPLMTIMLRRRRCTWTDRRVSRRPSATCSRRRSSEWPGTSSLLNILLFNDNKLRNWSEWCVMTSYFFLFVRKVKDVHLRNRDDMMMM